ARFACASSTSCRTNWKSLSGGVYWGMATPWSDGVMALKRRGRGGVRGILGRSRAVVSGRALAGGGGDGDGAERSLRGGHAGTRVLAQQPDERPPRPRQRIRAS